MNTVAKYLLIGAVTAACVGTIGLLSVKAAAAATFDFTQLAADEKAFNELSRCSDKALAEISLSRCDIPQIAAEAARKASGEAAR